MLKSLFLFKNEKGQALVEFALVVMMLFLILFGIVEFGRIFSASLTITHAAREGARVGIVSSNSTREEEIISAIQNRASVLNLNDDNHTIAILPDPGTASRGDQLTITITYDVDLIVPIISQILPNPFTLNSTAI
ncbi:MAG: TadE/TadG family type IV pilus assembly protein, partial [Bacillota bacterium]|nr:TadE/TadG family type IV pilus assembly protein [Bacillota bacterium]